MSLLSEYSMKRSYTTRAKEEQRRTAAPAFAGRVRQWRKRWAPLGHLSVPRWVRAEKATSLTPLASETAASLAPEHEEAAAAAEDMEGEDARYEAWRAARVKDRQQELEAVQRMMRAQQSQTDEAGPSGAAAPGRDSLGASRTPTPAPDLPSGRKSAEPETPVDADGAAVKRQKTE